MRHDLNTPDGLWQAYEEAGSWAALSRITGVAASTLKSRKDRFDIGRELTREELEASRS